MSALPERRCPVCSAAAPRHWGPGLCRGDVVVQRLGEHVAIHDIAGDEKEGAVK